MERHCIVCKEKIEECMGCVLARDVIDFIEGRRKDMREICWRDSFKLNYVYNPLTRELIERSQEDKAKDLEMYLAA
jgi:hypothetical protein